MVISPVVSTSVSVSMSVSSRSVNVNVTSSKCKVSIGVYSLKKGPFLKTITPYININSN